MSCLLWFNRNSIFIEEFFLCSRDGPKLYVCQGRVVRASHFQNPLAVAQHIYSSLMRNPVKLKTDTETALVLYHFLLFYYCATKEANRKSKDVYRPLVLGKRTHSSQWLGCLSCMLRKAWWSCARTRRQFKAALEFKQTHQPWLAAGWGNLGLTITASTTWGNHSAARCSNSNAAIEICIRHLYLWRLPGWDTGTTKTLVLCLLDASEAFRLLWWCHKEPNNPPPCNQHDTLIISFPLFTISLFFFSLQVTNSFNDEKKMDLLSINTIKSSMKKIVNVGVDAETNLWHKTLCLTGGRGSQPLFD